MQEQVRIKITSGFPSAANVAKKLGVSKKIAKDLSLLARRSLETGEYLLPGVGRIERVDRKAHPASKPAPASIVPNAPVPAEK